MDVDERSGLIQGTLIFKLCHEQLIFRSVQSIYNDYPLKGCLSKVTFISKIQNNTSTVHHIRMFGITFR